MMFKIIYIFFKYIHDIVYSSDGELMLVVVGWFGIIQVMTYHWIVGAGMLTLGLTSQML